MTVADIKAEISSQNSRWLSMTTEDLLLSARLHKRIEPDERLIAEFKRARDIRTALNDIIREPGLISFDNFVDLLEQFPEFNKPEWSTVYTLRRLRHPNLVGVDEMLQCVVAVNSFSVGKQLDRYGVLIIGRIMEVSETTEDVCLFLDGIPRIIEKLSHHHTPTDWMNIVVSESGLLRVRANASLDIETAAHIVQEARDLQLGGRFHTYTSRVWAPTEPDGGDSGMYVDGGEVEEWSPPSLAWTRLDRLLTALRA